MRWDLLVLAGEADLIPSLWAAFCHHSGVRDRAAFLKEGPLLPDSHPRGRPGPCYCSDEQELSLVAVQPSPVSIEANMTLNVDTFVCT